MPELFSRLYTVMAASAPPTSFQLVMAPVKMPASCSSESSFTELPAFTKTDRPSTATLYSVGTFLKALMQSAFSLGLIGREASAMSVVWFCNAAKPTPDPPPVTWIFTSGCLPMYTSAHFCASTTSVSEPFTVMSAAWLVTAKAKLVASSPTDKINFFIRFVLEAEIAGPGAAARGPARG